MTLILLAAFGLAPPPFDLEPGLAERASTAKPKPVRKAEPPKRRIPSPRIDMAAYVASYGPTGGFTPGVPIAGPKIGGCPGRRK